MLRSMSSPCQRLTIPPSIAMWSATHGSMAWSHQAPNGSATATGSAPSSRSAQQRGRSACRPSRSPRPRVGVVVATESPTATRPGTCRLSPVDVAQRPADEDVRGRDCARSGRVHSASDRDGCGRPPRRRPANRSALSAASAVGRTSTTEKWPRLVQEDQALVAVEARRCRPSGCHHGPGLGARVAAGRCGRRTRGRSRRRAGRVAAPARATVPSRPARPEASTTRSASTVRTVHDPSADDPTAVDDQAVDVTRCAA